MKMRSLTDLRIFFRDEDTPEIVLPLEKYGPGEFYSLDSDREVLLPNGESILVYAEVLLDSPVADISISVIDDGRTFGVRCAGGVIVTFETKQQFEVLLQMGSGVGE